MLSEPVQFRTIRSLQEIPLLIGECGGEQSGKRCKSWQNTWQSLAGERRSKQEGAAVTPCHAVVFTCSLPTWGWAPSPPQPHVPPRFPGTPSPAVAPGDTWWHSTRTAAAPAPAPGAPESGTSRDQKQLAVLLPSLTSASTLHWKPNITNLNPNLTSLSAKLLQTASDAPVIDFNSLLLSFSVPGLTADNLLKVEAIYCITSILKIEKK